MPRLLYWIVAVSNIRTRAAGRRQKRQSEPPIHLIFRALLAFALASFADGFRSQKQDAVQ